jgi:hypothetical protein
VTTGFKSNKESRKAGSKKRGIYDVEGEIDGDDPNDEDYVPKSPVQPKPKCSVNVPAQKKRRNNQSIANTPKNNAASAVVTRPSTSRSNKKAVKDQYKASPKTIADNINSGQSQAAGQDSNTLEFLTTPLSSQQLKCSTPQLGAINMQDIGYPVPKAMNQFYKSNMSGYNTTSSLQQAHGKLGAMMDYMNNGMNGMSNKFYGQNFAGMGMNSYNNSGALAMSQSQEAQNILGFDAANFIGPFDSATVNNHMTAVGTSITPPQVNLALSVGQSNATPQFLGSNYITPPNSNQSIGFDNGKSRLQGQGLNQLSILHINSNSAAPGEISDGFWDNVGADLHFGGRNILSALDSNTSMTPLGSDEAKPSSTDFVNATNVNVNETKLNSATNNVARITSMPFEENNRVRGGTDLSALNMDNYILNPATMMPTGATPQSNDFTGADKGADGVSKKRPDSVLGGFNEGITTDDNLGDLKFDEAENISIDALDDLFNYPY